MKKKRRTPPDLMTALDRAHEESTDLQVRALLHELQVHTEEITVQNEQLLKAQGELEQARDRFADLYDFAPIGYVSLDWYAKILEINLTGAQLLGKERRFLIDVPLPSLVVADDRERVRDFLQTIHSATGAPAQIEVTTRNPERVMRLLARPPGRGAAPNQILAAMIDVTVEHRLEQERQAAYESEQRKRAELAREVAARITSEERVKALLDRLIDVQEQERRRLAINLHDQLGQQLTALRLTLDAIKEVKPNGPDWRARFGILENIVNQLDRDVDFLAWELRPAALDDVGLHPALEEFVRQWARTHGVASEFHVTPGKWLRLAPEVESHLYRIVQEALNNVGKHAGAKHVSVLLERRRDEVRLIIEDDGKGFDPERTGDRAHHPGMGLSGMNERAAAIGGTLDCESAPGKGTSVFVRVPIPEGADSNPAEPR